MAPLIENMLLKTLGKQHTTGDRWSDEDLMLGNTYRGNTFREKRQRLAGLRLHRYRRPTGGL
jgi:hypothetical protein